MKTPDSATKRLTRWAMRWREDFRLWAARRTAGRPAARHADSIQALPGSFHQAERRHRRDAEHKERDAEDSMPVGHQQELRKEPAAGPSTRPDRPTAPRGQSRRCLAIHPDHDALDPVEGLDIYHDSRVTYIPYDSEVEMTPLDITKVRDAFGETLNRVAYGKERVLIRRRGKPLAALVSLDDLVLLEELEERLELEAARQALAESDERIPYTEVRRQLGLGT